MFPSSHQLQKSRRESSFREWKRPRGLLAWLWSNYVVVQHFSKCVTISFLCFTTNSVLVLFLALCEVSVHVFVHVRVQAKNSNRTTVRTFSNFNLLHGRCMLLPFPSALNVIVCSCLHGIPPIIDVRIKLWMNLIWWYVLGPPNHPIKFPSKFFSYMVICLINWLYKWWSKSTVSGKEPAV